MDQVTYISIHCYNSFIAHAHIHELKTGSVYIFQAHIDSFP